MKILEIKPLVFPEVKVIKFARFSDNRGYFTELYKRSDFQRIDFLKDKLFVQNNESFSKNGVIRGLHFQWSPYQEKLVRTVQGSIIDLFLDIRIGSSTFGKLGVYKLESKPEDDCFEWIWIPVGFAHGLFFLEDSTIEYFCTSEYSPSTEASISPVDPAIDWSLVEKNIAEQYKQSLPTANISDKDKEGITLDQWAKDARSRFYKYQIASNTGG
ncbi:dTDP-4-dehydrorhamnose 3,5-epimerase [Candidatus Roizmanbacteria bacterium CG_4_8_14_3_um_filter_36_12]|nr:MAG: dTDP-4-dehydrorhamnose 3,5-epimerase [Candidatus Roizmanbacteria bacterium CG_4_8_14_3_um_filter_36_12]